MISENDILVHVQHNLELIRKLRAQVAEKKIPVDVSMNFKLATEYLSMLDTPNGVPDNLLYLLTRAHWNIGAAQGKVMQYAEMQESDPGKDHD